MKKTVLNYGLLSGGVSALLMLFMALYIRDDPSRFKNGELFGYTGIILSMVLVYLGVRAYRDQVVGGTISFGKAFQVGLLIALISCACYVVAWMLISKTLMPNFMEQFVTYSLNELKASGASPEEISRKAAEMEQYKTLYKNPLMTAAVTFLEPLPVGLLVTLLTAGILGRR